MLRSRWIVLVVALLGLTLMGAQCGSTKRKVIKKSKTKKWKSHKFVMDSVALDSAVKNNIKIANRLYTEVDGFAKAEFHLENTSRRTMRIECRIRFFDEHDSHMESVLGFWHPYVVYPNSKKAVSATAPKRGALRAELSYRTTKKYKYK